MSSVRARVRDAVIALLQDMPGKIPVRAYRGELGAKEEDAMRALNGMCPGILVSIERGGFRGVQVQRRRYRWDLAIVLRLASSMQSTREDRDDELAELEDEIIARLTGALPALDGLVPVGHLEPVSDEVWVHTPEVCIWEMVWKLTVEVELAEKPAAPITETLGRINAPQDEDNAADPIVQVSTLITIP